MSLSYLTVVKAEKDLMKITYDESKIGPVILIFKAMDADLIIGVYRYLNKIYDFYLYNNLENCIYSKRGKNSLYEDTVFGEYEVFRVIRKS